jgi:hypothetical protein
MFKRTTDIDLYKKSEMNTINIRLNNCNEDVFSYYFEKGCGSCVAKGQSADEIDIVQ